MQLEPMKLWHFHALPVHASQRALADRVTDAALERATESGTAVACVRDGQVYAVAGLVPLWEGRWNLWSFLGVHTGPHMLALTRLAKERLPEYSGRIEATTPVGFAAGHRWLRLLGFQREDAGGLRSYYPDGGTAALYARVNR